MYSNQALIDSIRTSSTLGPCVSMYFNQGHGRLSEVPRSVEFSRRISYARKLLESTLSKEAAADYVRPLVRVAAEELLKDAPATFALFLSGDVSRCVRLPDAVPNCTVVAPDFHIKPLLPKQSLRENPSASKLLEEGWQALVDGGAATGLYEVVKALRAGRVRHLWVAEDVTIWGVVNRRLGTLVLHSEQMGAHDGDVLDDLSEWALDEGAEVTMLPLRDIPGNRAAVALLNESIERNLHAAG